MSDSTASRDVFISYSHVDAELAVAVRDAIEAAGTSCWMAPRDIVAGDTYPEQIVNALKAARACLLLLSEHSNASRQVRSEIELAFSSSISIIPFNLDDVRPTGDLRYLLAGTHWLAAGPNPYERIDELVAHVRLILERYAPTSEKLAEPQANATPEARTNLTFDLTPLIGREDDLTLVTSMLQRARLVTLLGPGGVGKTRLANALGSQLLEAYSAGVWFVDLQAVTDPAFVANAIGEVFDVHPAADEHALDAIIRTIRLRSLLLIIDNCEQVSDAVAKAADAILKQCSAVRILATSRQPLGISGEQTHRLPSLSIESSAELFETKARAVKSSFELREGDREIVEEICRRLDGIPLAIELAAARVKALALPAIRDRLSERFRILTGGSTTALPRQQTLAALIDWSYQLLSPDEADFFARLGSITGKFSVELATAISADKDDLNTLDRLASLVDKSLVNVEEGADHTFYRLLESIRAFAESKIEPARREELDQARTEYYLTLSASFAEGMMKGDSSAMPLIEGQLDDLRSVLHRTLAEQKDVTSGVTIMDGLVNFWNWTGREREALQWYANLNGMQFDEATQALVDFGAGIMEFHLESFNAATKLLSRALRTFESGNDTLRKARAQNALAGPLQYSGDLDGAMHQLEKALENFKCLGLARGIASTLLNLASLYSDFRHDAKAALTVLQEAFPYVEEFNDKSLRARLMDCGADLELQIGDVDGALSKTERSLLVWRQLGNESLTAEGLRRLARCYERKTEFRAARMLLSEGFRIYEKLAEPAESAACAFEASAILLREGRSRQAAQAYGFATELIASSERYNANQPETLRHEIESELGTELFAALYAVGRTHSAAELQEALRSA